ncbi:MAG: hypothetical protein JNG89_08320 [Planctomycetaceae bacterium]|nr:hypothetical protein [Planctomycetaceae bacterium]
MPDVTPAPAKWWRIAAVLLGLLLAGAAVTAAEIGSGGRSPGALAAAGTAAAAALVCLAAALAPSRRLQALSSRWQGVATRLQQRPASISLPAGAALVALAFVSFSLIVVRLLSIPQDPWDDDQGAFLLTAQEIDAHGGIAWLWAALWSGEFAEANRHPLYLALLSSAPTLRAGQWLSAALGAIILTALIAVTMRRSGRRAAGIAGILLATNSAFCLFSARVVCDVLLVGLCGLVWLIHVPGAADTRQRALSPLRCAAGGALLGLAWLTKGTGLPLFAGYMLWLMIVSLWPTHRRTEDGQAVDAPRIGIRVARPILALIAFLAIASPLIARNMVRFGNPFHNLNSLLLFADRYEELDGMLARQTTTGDAARNYLATHSAGDMLRREARGLVWEAFIILRSLGPAPLDDARLLFGLPLAVLAAARAAARRSAADALMLIWAGLSWVLFAWYVPIAAGERFILPLLAPTLILAADALARIVTTPDGKVRPWSVAAAILWTVLWVASCWVSSGFADRNG